METLSRNPRVRQVAVDGVGAYPRARAQSLPAMFFVCPAANSNVRVIRALSFALVLARSARRLDLENPCQPDTVRGATGMTFTTTRMDTFSQTSTRHRGDVGRELFHSVLDELFRTVRIEKAQALDRGIVINGTELGLWHGGDFEPFSVIAVVPIPPPSGVDLADFYHSLLVSNLVLPYGMVSFGAAPDSNNAMAVARFGLTDDSPPPEQARLLLAQLHHFAAAVTSSVGEKK